MRALMNPAIGGMLSPIAPEREKNKNVKL